MDYKIKNVEKDTENFVVEFDILEGEKVVGTSKHAFSLEMSEQEIKNELKKVANIYELEKEQIKKQKEKDLKEEKAQKVIENLLNKVGEI